MIQLQTVEKKLKGYRLAEHVARQIADEHGLTLEQVRQKNNSQVIMKCRDEISYVLRRSYHYSYPDIGVVLNKDHSTIMLGEKRHGRLLGSGC
jgi:chromosomal replication initiation ATPase DnaA